MSAGVELDYAPRHRDFEPRGRDTHHHYGPKISDDEIDEIRRPADEEYRKRTECMKRAHEAYERGDGAGAKQLSNDGKAHAAEGDRLNQVAAEEIFARTNVGLESDTIDLHNLYVHEAVDFTTNRIRAEQERGGTHLHVIVGQGHHSIDHKQRIKPAIEELCENLGLQYETEENAGRIYIKLPPLVSQHGDYQHHPQHTGGNQQQYYPGQQQQHHGGQHQEEDEYDEIGRFLKKLVNKYCCAVM